MSEELKQLTELSRELLEGCKKAASDGTILFTPDGVGNYDALWVRDLGYMAEYCGDLMGAKALEACIEFVLTGQREDGWVPDRVESSGEPVYAAGAKGTPVGEANLDNTPFLVFAVYSYLRLPEVEASGEGKRKFFRWAEALDRGMDCIPLSGEGLLWNDPTRPHSPYGFTDTVCKTGRLFFESLLYWRACRQLAELCRGFGDLKDRAGEYDLRAERIEREIVRLYDEESGLFFAAEQDCRQLDVWGAAYLLYIGFPVEEQVKKGLEDWLATHRDRYLYHGQVCHLPDGEPWEKLLIYVAPGEYQNGAYWATASGWIWYVLKGLDPEAAENMLRELLTDFQEGGICECVNCGYRKLPEFVVSAVNVRGAVLRWEQENG